MIHPTEDNHKWLWLCQKDKQKILIYSRLGIYPYDLDEKFFSHLKNQINGMYHIQLGGDSKVLPVIRGIFLDDKNGNVGSICVDVFYDPIDSNFLDFISKIEEISVPKCDECDLHLSVNLFKKETYLASDYFSIEAEYQFKETKKEIFWS